MTPNIASWLCPTDWLELNLTDPDLVILDASWHLPDQNRDAQADYAASHIPGALFFDIDKISYPDTPLPHMLPSEEEFANHMQRLGVGDGTTVVVYDQSAVHSAARAWWMLRVFGFKSVMVLDGGLDKWRKEGRPLEDTPPTPQKRTFTAHRQDHRVADLALVEKASENGKPQLLDARSPSRFAGKEKEARPGLRSGHIPGSANLHYQKLYKEDGTLKDSDTLKKLFIASGIDLDRPVITSCGSGISACTLALGLSVTGHDKWAVYDGSWTEWGAGSIRPVETGSRNS